MFKQGKQNENTIYLIHSLEFNNEFDDIELDYEIIDKIRKNLNLEELVNNEYIYKNDNVYEKFKERQVACPRIFEWVNIYYFENYVSNDINDPNWNIQKDYDYEDEYIASNDINKYKQKYTNIKLLFVEFDCRNLTQDIINILKVWRNDDAKDADEVIEHVPKRINALIEYLDTKNKDEHLDKTIREMSNLHTENLKLLYEELNIKSRYAFLMDCIHFHSMKCNGMLSEENKNTVPYFLKQIEKNIRKNNEYNTTELIIKDKLKTELKNHQISNINWMIEREKNSVKDYFTDNKIVHFPDGRICNYDNNVILSKEDIDERSSNLNGGVLNDVANSGKTLQILSLALTTPELLTVVIVENNNKQIWCDEIKKHLNEIPNFIEIVTYKNFNNYEKKYDRLVIDNFEKIININDDDDDEKINKDYYKLFTKKIFSECKHKWVLMTTQINKININILFNIFKFLTNQGIQKKTENEQKFINKSCLLNRHYEYLYPLIIKSNVLSKEELFDDDKIDPKTVEELEESNKEYDNESDEEYDNESDEESDNESDEEA
jgi:hypothetical protein